MSALTVAGAGAFGTALAITLAAGERKTTLWARDAAAVEKMRATRQNGRYLGGVTFPGALEISAEAAALARADTVLLAVPTQHLRAFVQAHRAGLAAKTCVVCCKGIEKNTGLLPAELVAALLPRAKIAVLTGPGFATEIARGLPTALTLATKLDDAAALQARLSTDCLRLYLSDDLIGAGLGGALKNVIAIACGLTIGAGLGESARAALMTRGYAEMLRLAVSLGADAATLAGLSGLGDLALTCTSAKSRNYSLGFQMGKGGGAADGTTFEGVATARACLTLADELGIDMPVARIVAEVLERKLTIPEAAAALLSRPLKSET